MESIYYLHSNLMRLELSFTFANTVFNPDSPKPDSPNR